MNKGVSMVRIKHWTDVVQAANKSGMRKNDWCEKNGININTFYYWQRRIRDFALTGLAQPTGMMSDDSTAPDSSHDPEFFELSLQSEAFPIRVSTETPECISESIHHHGSIPSISIRCGLFSVDVRDGFSKETLSGVIEVLKNV